MSDHQQQTEEWYRSYHTRRGKDRNNILANAGVLFQLLATQKSVVEALRRIPVDLRTWKVLDVGCGDGAGLVSFLNYGFEPDRLYGIDIMPELIVAAQKKLPNATLVCGDAAKMEFQTNTFDLVMESTMFIQLLDDMIANTIASEMLRVAKSGTFVMLVDWRYDYGHPEYKAVTSQRIKKLFQVGDRSRLIGSIRGALVPPIGRRISAGMSSIYFPVARLFPVLVGQVTTVLQKLS